MLVVYGGFYDGDKLVVEPLGQPVFMLVPELVKPK